MGSVLSPYNFNLQGGYPQGTDPETYGTVEGVYYGLTPTKYVTVAAAGGGDGSFSAPWTLSEAMASASAGDIVGIDSGVYVGTEPAGTKSFSPAFMPVNSGTLVDPITFVAKYPAYNNESNVTDIRSGATVGSSGWPAFGSLSKDYIEWAGIKSDNNDANNKQATDSAPCTIWSGTGLKVFGCKLVGESGLADNYSGVRFENCIAPEAADNVISGFKLTVNKAGFIIYKSQNPKIHHNTIYDCDHGVQVKGSTLGSDIYGLDIYQNLIHDCLQMFRFHGPIKGPSSELSLIYQNIGYNLVNVAEFTSSGSHVGEQDGLRVFNNSFYNVSDGDWWIAFDYTLEGTVPRDNAFFNNIHRTTAAYLRGMNATTSTVTIHQDFGEYTRNCISNYTMFGDGSSSSALDTLTFADWQSTYTEDVNSITSDPLFTDEVGFDFTLQGGSPCLTLGRDNLGKFGVVDAVIPSGAYVTGTETIGVRL